jgi:hypothetical protein
VREQRVATNLQQEQPQQPPPAAKTRSRWWVVLKAIEFFSWIPTTSWSFEWRRKKETNTGGRYAESILNPKP